MKTSKLFTSALFLIGILISGNILAQTDYATTGTQTVRNTSAITYTISNPEGVNATYIWTVTNGTIVESGTTTYSPVASASATLSINVTWNNTNTTTANAGTVRVTKTIGGCPGTAFILNVDSWVAPNVNAVTTSTPTICSGSAPTIGLDLQGCPLNSGFSYTWEIRDASNNLIESKTATSSSATIASVPAISNITNSLATNQIYTFKVVSLLDGLSGAAITSFTASSVNFTVSAVPTISNISSSASLTAR